MGRVTKAPPDWRSDPRLWEPHVDTYSHRKAVESAARKHGLVLGDNFVALLVARLTVVDVDRWGARPTPSQAWRTVTRWAADGPRARKAAPA